LLITLAEFKIEEVLPFVYTEGRNIRKEYKVGNDTYSVNMNSLRYHTFKKCIWCVCCGLQGDRFLLQFSGSKEAWEKKLNISAHFNLFAGSVLMSKDHIHPKGKGGKDHIDNLQTMCQPCNVLKDNKEITIEQLRKLRKAMDSESIMRLLGTLR
jgi:hypothetical protein